MVARTGSHSSWLSRITQRLLAVWAGVNILVLLPAVVGKQNLTKDKKVLLKLVLVWWIKEEIPTSTGASCDWKERAEGVRESMVVVVR